MLIIRLQRIGKRGRPSYRFIVSEKHHDTQSGSAEILGVYQPVGKEKIFKVDAERIKYWISKGAQMSPTVNNLLLKEKIIEGKKEKAVYFTKKRKEKIAAKKAEAEKAQA